MSGDDSDYHVGYKRPPKHTRFRKGQSGNSKGRPKTSESFGRLARRALGEKVVIRENGERRTITKLQAALKQLTNKAAAGDPRAIREIIKLQPLITQHDQTEDEKGTYVFRWADSDPTDPANGQPLLNDKGWPHGGPIQRSVEERQAAARRLIDEAFREPEKKR